MCKHVLSSQQDISTARPVEATQNFLWLIRQRWSPGRRDPASRWWKYHNWFNHRSWVQKNLKLKHEKHGWLNLRCYEIQVFFRNHGSFFFPRLQKATTHGDECIAVMVLLFTRQVDGCLLKFFNLCHTKIYRGDVSRFGWKQFEWKDARLDIQDWLALSLSHFTSSSQDLAKRSARSLELRCILQKVSPVCGEFGTIPCPKKDTPSRCRAKIWKEHLQTFLCSDRGLVTGLWPLILCGRLTVDFP